jgi:hypothetical protein
VPSACCGDLAVGAATAEVGLPCDRNCVAGLSNISAAAKRLSDITSLAADRVRPRGLATPAGSGRRRLPIRYLGPHRGGCHIGESFAGKRTAHGSPPNGVLIGQ